MEDINEHEMKRANEDWASCVDGGDYEYITTMLRQYEAIRKKYEGDASKYLNGHRLVLQQYLKENTQCYSPYDVNDWRRKATQLEIFVYCFTENEEGFANSIWHGIWDEGQFSTSREVLASKGALWMA